tara:strand:+ start:50374 stop:51411 length:1038 start_codon:yes stop_codon:yes gene_type:complete
MRWNLQLAVLLGLSISDVASLAQRPPDDERLSSISGETDPSAYRDAGYFDSDGVARFQLIQGRLCLDAPRHRKGAQHHEQDGVFESITITAHRGVPSVHYIHRTKQHETRLSVQNANDVRIESLLTSASETSVIDQPSADIDGGNSIEWTVTHADETKVFTGATLLHIRNSDPIRFDNHYGPLLRRLLRGRTIQSLSEQTDVALIARIQTSGGIDIDAVNDAIDRLAANKLSIRRQAHQELLACGSPVLPIIYQRSIDDLDNEQIERLREITSMLQPRTDDTPATLSALLVNDADHWKRIAQRLSPQEIQLANVHLQRIGREPLRVHETVTSVVTREQVEPSTVK